jgi:hypothetical protein
MPAILPRMKKPAAKATEAILPRMKKPATRAGAVHGEANNTGWPQLQLNIADAACQPVDTN